MNWTNQVDYFINKKAIDYDDRSESKSQRFLSFVYDGYTCKWIKIRREK